MTTSQIIQLPHPSLRQPSQRVSLINEQTQKLVNNMIEQALAWEANRRFETTVGLAAVQINHHQRIIIIRGDPKSTSSDSFQVLINPKIKKLTGPYRTKFEGCLSVDRYYAKVTRASQVKLEALTPTNQLIKLNVGGFLARVIQHEIDHLKGIMTVDRVTDPKTGFAVLDSSGQIKPVAKEVIVRSGLLSESQEE